MDIEYHKWWSPSLNQDIELKVYGKSGKPVLIFPAMNGRFYEAEDFGLVGAVAGMIDSGKIQLFTPDSVDSQSWTNQSISAADRARRHEDYDRYITTEVVPLIHQKNGSDQPALTTGCSMGGYHALNFFFRHPDVFDAVISLSGIARLDMFVGDYMDANIYLNSPILYLKNMKEGWYLEQFRKSKIVICSGQGTWEEQTLADMRCLADILKEKDVPCWLDLWGYDVNHDWPWWRKQLPYFLNVLGYNT